MIFFNTNFYYKIQLTMKMIRRKKNKRSTCVKNGEKKYEN